MEDSAFISISAEERKNNTASYLNPSLRFSAMFFWIAVVSMRQKNSCTISCQAMRISVDRRRIGACKFDDCQARSKALRKTKTGSLLQRLFGATLTNQYRSCLKEANQQRFLCSDTKVVNLIVDGKIPEIIRMLEILFSFYFYIVL